MRSAEWEFVGQAPRLAQRQLTRRDIRGDSAPRRWRSLANPETTVSFPGDRKLGAERNTWAADARDVSNQPRALSRALLDAPRTRRSSTSASCSRDRRERRKTCSARPVRARARASPAVRDAACCRCIAGSSITAIPRRARPGRSTAFPRPPRPPGGGTRVASPSTRPWSTSWTRALPTASTRTSTRARPCSDFPTTPARDRELQP